MLHSSSIKIGYKVETAFAAGNGSSKYEMDPFAAGEVASLTTWNLIYKDSPNLGLTEIEKDILHPAGHGADYKLVKPKSVRFKEFTITHVIQNATWIQAAIAQTAGAVNLSYVIHVEIPGETGIMDYFDLCGCVLTKYEMTVDGQEIPIEKLTFSVYGVVNSVAVTSMPVMSTADYLTHDLMAISCYGDTYTDSFGYTLSIENKVLDQPVSGKLGRADPGLLTRDASVNDFKFYTDAGAILGSALQVGLTALESLTLFDVVITYGTLGAITLANMYVDTDNLGELKTEQDIVDYNMTLMAGTNPSYSWA